ncbi:MAG: DUF3604 domain-containing protein [Clostridiales bacterium]|nr:DUF3604 domain-containing protein [Clostridiales bacterium]
MSKRLQYFNEVQIMHNGMEHISSTNGTVSVFPEEATVGQPVTVKVTYTVGEDVIYANGVLRFTIPFGFVAPQVEMPIYPGYTTAETTRSNASVKTFIVKNDWWKRGPDRTKPENVCEHVGTHVWVRVLGHDLLPGDQVILTYGDTSYTKQAAGRICRTSGPVQFDVATDQRGDLAAPYSGYYRIQDPAIMEVYAEQAEAFEVVIPSDLEKGKTVLAHIFAIDRFHNLAQSYTGTALCKVNGKPVGELLFSADDCGIKKLILTPDTLGTLRVTAEAEGMETGKSNPAVVTEAITGPRHFWGDMHGHTGIQWGRGSGRSYYEYAKEVACVDFCALTDPDAGRYTNNNATCKDSLSVYMSDKQWKEIQDVNKQFHEEGRFIPLLGYEYHNDAPNPEFGGDRNVYYESYDEPIRRCCDEGSYTPKELWAQLKEQKVRALTIPHHTAKKVMLGSWELHDPEIQRLVEIYSSWGNSECEGCERPIIGGAVYEDHSVQYALSKGYRLGFVTGSDSHAGTPGYCHWVFSSDFEGYRGGLTCIMTDKLTKQSLFDALYNRQTYATTGQRILLEFTVNGAPMGQEIPLAENPVRELKVKVLGTDEIDHVEIISMGHTVCRKAGNGTAELEFTFTDTTEPADGWMYYYVRVHQKDKALAWSSPVWVS